MVAVDLRNLPLERTAIAHLICDVAVVVGGAVRVAANDVEEALFIVGRSKVDRVKEIEPRARRGRQRMIVGQEYLQCGAGRLHCQIVAVDAVGIQFGE